MFADYRVPVVLRQLGILQYSSQLTSKVTHIQHCHSHPVPWGSMSTLEAFHGAVLCSAFPQWFRPNHPLIYSESQAKFLHFASTLEFLQDIVLSSL